MTLQRHPGPTRAAGLRVGAVRAIFAMPLAVIAVSCSRHGPRGGPVPVLDRPHQAFVRVIAPFMVTDSTGRALELAFHGGFNVPRPQLIDIDGDGVLDLFVQEETGSVSLFKGHGMVAGLPRFTLHSLRFAELDVGEWYRFADVDLDGDLDLLTERPYSYIRYYRNEGTADGTRFVLAADSLRDVEGRAIFSDRQNIPQLADLDCNGRVDLLLGQLDGTVSRYEAVAPSGGGAPRFELVSSEFEGIRIIGQGAVRNDASIGPGSVSSRKVEVHRINGLSGSPSRNVDEQATMYGNRPTRHGANTMALADHDGDGDLDLFWGDYFEPGLLLIQNAGRCGAPNFRSPPIQFPVANPILTSGYNAPTFGDIDGDGRVDLVMGVLGGAYNPIRTSVENLYYVHRSSDDGWRVATKQLLPVLDVGSESIPSLVDIDGDGDLDLLVSNKIDPSDQTTSRIYHFENTGTRSAPSLRLRGALPFSGRFHLAPAFGDIDGDGQLDVVVGQWGASLAWYRGGREGFSLVDSTFITITRGSNTTPTLGDLDGDGDLDLIVGEASGALNYYRNDGGPGAPRFVLVSDEWEGIRVGRRSSPHLVDLDGDGDLDMLVGAEEGIVALFRNVGSRTVARFERDESFELKASPLAVPAAGDMDGDGVPEILVGGSAGGVLYFAAERAGRQ